MKLTALNPRPEIKEDSKLYKNYIQFDKLIKIISNRKLPIEIANTINKDIQEINTTTGSEKKVRNLIRKKQARIVQSLEKELKLVPKNHYRNMWIAVGMAAFGIPLGVAFGASLGNMGYLGIGLPIGMVIGMAVGIKMDEKAVKEDRQLDIELKP
jgi:hypothetical protein